jgi:hypothetical protein
VVSLKLDVRLADQANTLAIRVRQATAGWLPLPLSDFLDQISEAASNADLMLSWAQHDGDPVALVTLPAGANQAESFLLSLVEIGDGTLVIAGQSPEPDPPPAESAGSSPPAPTAPSGPPVQRRLPPRHPGDPPRRTPPTRAATERCRSASVGPPAARRRAATPIAPASLPEPCRCPGPNASPTHAAGKQVLHIPDSRGDGRPATGPSAAWAPAGAQQTRCAARPVPQTSDPSARVRCSRAPLHDAG